MAEAKSRVDCDYYQTYLPPPQLGKWAGFKRFLWNSESKEFLGRTGSSWFKVTVFYIIFYICLAAFFAIMLVIFYQTLDYYEPKWTMGSSLIGTNPGLGFRPMPEKNVESTLIWFQRGSSAKWGKWADSLDKFLDPYDFGKQYGHTFKKCDGRNPIEKGKVCHVNLLDFGDKCIKEKRYGFDQNMPCVIIKMNKIWGWTPTPYLANETLPDEMPSELKGYIDTKGRQDFISNGTNYVWLSCQGENPADRENIGEIKYYPAPGFPTYFFPFINTPGYLAPLVFIQFESLNPGILINVECKAWAHNIIHSRMERRGSVHFEILMD